MTTFAQAVDTQMTETTNGMPAFEKTGKNCLDLFYRGGSLRTNQDEVLRLFAAAHAENAELATRIALWLRDVRGGAGERESFRTIAAFLDARNPTFAKRILPLVPELGRWDDLLAFEGQHSSAIAAAMIGSALAQGNGLCAKWMPRKGAVAAKLRTMLGMSPKQYRKTLVGLTKVVETQMCAKDWDNINYSHVPSLAMSRYRIAFMRTSPKFKEYTEALVKGDPTVKVNAGAVYPYDVTKSLYAGCYHNAVSLSSEEVDLITAQWNALENFIGDSCILPMVDVSGSMSCSAGGNLSCMEVAISLGMYCADKNQGEFKDLILTFSSSPQLVKLKGTIADKYAQLRTADWGMSTNIAAAFDKLLDVAIAGNVPQERMPKMLLIMSDMQFNACASFNSHAMDVFQRKFSAAGYVMPKIVFWNLNGGYNNAPAQADTKGVALVSGFSPSVLKAVLAGDIDQFSPEAIMLKTVMVERYNF